MAYVNPFRSADIVRFEWEDDSGRESFNESAYNGQSNQNSCDYYLFKPILALVVRPQNFVAMRSGLSRATKGPQSMSMKKSNIVSSGTRNWLIRSAKASIARRSAIGAELVRPTTVNKNQPMATIKEGFRLRQFFEL